MGPRGKQALYFAVLGGTIAFSVVFLYLAIAGSSVPLPWYYPLERVWRLESQHQGLAMDFYGRTLAAALAALAAAFAVAGVYRSRKLAGEDEHLFWAGWAAIALILALALIAWMLAFRVISPGPPPPRPPSAAGAADPAGPRA